MMTPGPYTRQLMQGSTSRAIGNVLQNLGMGIMGLSMKRPDMAMQAFARPMEDPRRAMMEAARLDMATQQMAAQQAQAAREAQEREQRQRTQQEYLQGLSDEERIRAQVVGPAEYAKMATEAALEGPDLMTGVRINPDTGEREIDPLWIKMQSLKKPLVQVNQGARFSENYQPVYNEKGELVEVVPIKGSKADPMAQPKSYTPESAGKGAMVVGSLETLGEVKNFLFPEGKFNQNAVLQMNAPLIGGVPRTEGRQRRQEMEDVFATKLRLETGAAFGESEVANIAKRFLPDVLDDEAAVRSKMDRLEQFLSTSLKLFDPKLYQRGLEKAREQGAAVPGAAGTGDLAQPLPSNVDPLGIR